MTGLQRHMSGLSRSLNPFWKNAKRVKQFKKTAKKYDPQKKFQNDYLRGLLGEDE